MVRKDRARDSTSALQRLVSTSGALDSASQDVALDATPPGDSVEDASALKAKADAMGVLIRSGVKPDDAAHRVGLDGMEFWDARPVTLKYEDED